MSAKDICVFWGGDYAPVWGYEKLKQEHGINLLRELVEEIAKSDFSIVNLECPLCYSGSRISKTGPCLRADPFWISCLHDSGIKAVTLANNHILDYGTSGLHQTIRVCSENSIIPIGVGDNYYESTQPIIYKINGVTIGIIAVTETEFSIAGSTKPGAAAFNIIENTYQILGLREKVDLLLFSIHGGNEHFEFPRPGLKSACRFFIDMGADLVVCTHSHIAGAYEEYKGKFIVYGLGNLIFGRSLNIASWNIGYAISIVFSRTREVKSFSVIPYEQKTEYGGIMLLDGVAKDSFFADMERKNTLLKNEEAYMNEWKKYCSSKCKEYYILQYSPFLIRGIGRVFRLFPNRFFLGSKKRRLLRYNTLFCESHLESFMKSLKDDIIIDGGDR